MTSEKAEESQLLEEAKRHYNWGYDAFELGLYEIAIDEYTTAIQLNPSYAKAYANRGIAYRKLKRHAEAMVDLKAAAQLGSTVARDDLLKKGRKNKIILAIVAYIVVSIIISAWQEHNEKAKSEERQRQQVIAAEQARAQVEQKRIKAEQELNKLIKARNDDRFDRKLRHMTGEETQADRIEKKLEQIQDDLLLKH